MPTAPIVVFQQHSDAVAARDLDGVLATFAPDAVLADNNRIGRGHDYIREVYAAAIDIGSELQPELSVLVQDSVVYVTFRSARPGCPDLIGTGTYIIEDGLITVHTDFNTVVGSGRPTTLESTAG